MVPEDRDALVVLATELEEGAEEPSDAFDAKLRSFNERTHATCTRDTFRFLYQSESPTQLVDRLIEWRDAPPFVPPTRPDEVLALAQRAALSGRHVELSRAGDAVAHVSKLPSSLAHQLGSGFGVLPCWPPLEASIAFALSYEPPSTRDALLALVRRWLDDADAKRATPEAALGEAILFDRQLVLDLPELRGIVRRLAMHVPAQRAIALTMLRDLVGPRPDPAPAAPSAAVAVPPTTEAEHVMHAKFGRGLVVSRSGTGAEAKLVVRFESGERTLLARFVTPA